MELLGSRRLLASGKGRAPIQSIFLSAETITARSSRELIPPGCRSYSEGYAYPSPIAKVPLCSVECRSSEHSTELP